MKPILRHLLLMGLSGVVLALLGAGALSWYTHHGEEIEIPELRGKTVEQVAQELDALDLRYEVIDSIYVAEAIPNTIHESSPEGGHKVKPGRIVFLVTYAFAPRQLPLPHVAHMSARQAVATLRGMGFDQLELRIVSGEFRDLCLGVHSADGKPLEAGTKLAPNTKLVVLISGTIIDTLHTEELIDTEGKAEWIPDASVETDSATTNNSEDWW